MSDGSTFDDEILAEVDRLRQEVGQLRRREHELTERNQDLAALTAIATAVNQSLELQEVVDVAVERTLDALNISAGVLCLYDQASATHTVQAMSVAPFMMRRNAARIAARRASSQWIGLAESKYGTTGHVRTAQ